MKAPRPRPAAVALATASLASASAPLWAVDDLLALGVVIAGAALAGLVIVLLTGVARAELVHDGQHTQEIAWRDTPGGYFAGRIWFLLPSLVAFGSGLRAWQASVALLIFTPLVAGALWRSLKRARARSLEPLRWSDAYLEECRVRWGWGVAVVAFMAAITALGTLAWREPLTLNDYLPLLGVSIILGTGAASVRPFFALQSRGLREHWPTMIIGWLAWFAMGSAATVTKHVDDGAITLGVDLVTSAAFVAAGSWCARVAARARVAELRAEGHEPALAVSYPELVRLSPARRPRG